MPPYRSPVGGASRGPQFIPLSRAEAFSWVKAAHGAAAEAASVTHVKAMWDFS